MQTIGKELFSRLVERAKASPRRRTNHNFHQTADENPNRFLNVLIEGTYIAPHRHLDPPKPEAFLVLEGKVALFVFNDDGAIEECRILGPETVTWGVDVPAGVWHTMAVLSPHAICYEVKPGPYVPGTDKDFAPWAPREGEAGVAEYLERLVDAAGRALRENLP
ncbi:MAG: WbuC family cupin fold metalloprotein [Bryobacteraceae bacterium]